MRTRSAYARADSGDQRVKHKAKPVDAKLLADLGRGLDKYFAQQERGTGYGHRPEVRRPFVRKKQEPPPCCSLRQAILLSFKSEIRTFKSYGMIRVPNASATSTEGWESYILDDGQRK